MVDFPSSEIACSFGDTITATIEATSATTAIATIENCSTGKIASVSVSSTSGGTTHPLCQVDADWTLEADAALVPDFGSVTFTGAIATLENGTTVAVGASTAYTKIIKDASGTPETSVATSGSSMTISYIY